MTIPTGESYISGDDGGHLMMHISELNTLAGTTVPDKAQDLADAINAIADALNGLELSWAGDAKDEAKKLIDRWQTASDQVFGTSDGKKRGVLNALAGGLEVAASVYNQSEMSIAGSWDELQLTLTGVLQGVPSDSTDSGGSSDQSPPISEV